MVLFWDLGTCSTRSPVAGNVALVDNKPCPARCHQEDINASHLQLSRGTWNMPRALDLPRSFASTCEPRPVVHRRGRPRALAHPSGPSSEHDGFSSCGHRDLKVTSRTSWTTLLALQVSTEQGVGWMTGGQNFNRFRSSALHAWKAGDEPRRTSRHASRGA